MTTSEVDALNPEATAEGPITLSNGLKVNVNRLKTRETLKLLKIITRGAGYALSTLDLSGDSEDITQSLLLAVTMAVPHAEDETLEFVAAMIAPVGLVEGSKLSKNEREVNSAILEQFEEVIDNPELEDLVAILSAIVTAEAPHIQALGKRLGLLLKTYRPENS